MEYEWDSTCRNDPSELFKLTILGYTEEWLSTPGLGYKKTD